MRRSRAATLRTHGRRRRALLGLRAIHALLGDGAQAQEARVPTRPPQDAPILVLDPVAPACTPSERPLAATGAREEE